MDYRNIFKGMIIDHYETTYNVKITHENEVPITHSLIYGSVIRKFRMNIVLYGDLLRFFEEKTGDTNEIISRSGVDRAEFYQGESEFAYWILGVMTTGELYDFIGTFIRD